MSRLLGIRCDVVMKEEIVYVLFYDIDKTLTPEEIQFINGFCRMRNISYILYSTKNGTHLVGLTPMNFEKLGNCHSILKNRFNSYYGGIILRLSRKEGEEQKLIDIHLEYGEVIPNLYNLYTKRFNLKPMKWIKEISKHILVFEKYRTKKE